MDRWQGKCFAARIFYRTRRVPYDGYRAILHEGERVVTASKAQESERKERRTFGDIHIHVGSVNGDNVTEIVREMAAQFERALGAVCGMI